MYINALFQALTLKYLYVQDFVIFVCAFHFPWAVFHSVVDAFARRLFYKKMLKSIGWTKPWQNNGSWRRKFVRRPGSLFHIFFWHRKAPKATVKSFLPNLHDFAGGFMLWHHDSQMIFVTPWHVTLDLRWFWGDSWRAHQSFMKFQAWIKD